MIPDPRTRIVDLTGGEKLRMKPGVRDGLPVVRLDLLAPVAKHTSALSVVGQPVAVPLEAVTAMLEALDRTRAEMAEAAASQPPQAAEDQF